MSDSDDRSTTDRIRDDYDNQHGTAPKSDTAEWSVHGNAAHPVSVEVDGVDVDPESVIVKVESHDEGGPDGPSARDLAAEQRRPTE